MADVKLIQTPDDGDIVVEAGVVQLTLNKETAVYVSLFGGNAEDAGSADSRLQWWGNHGEEEQDKHMRSRTQHLLNGIPAVSGNVKRIIDAARADLDWLGDDLVDVTASITGPKRIQITITSNDASYTFNEGWGL